MKELYQVLSGALGQEQRLAQLANNLANINTPGFHQDRSVFTNYFAQALAAQAGGGAPAASANPAQSVWPVLTGTYVDATPGPIHRTGQPLDVAIEDSQAFFQVQLEGQSGTFYTRAGNFTLNADRELITAAGHRVLDGGGSPLTVDLTQGTPSITPDGTIRVGTTTAGQIGVVRFANPTQLLKYGDGLLQAPPGGAPEAVDKAVLRPAALEGSNVNAIGSMIDMIQTERAYQSQQKMMQTLDELVSERIQSAR